ncbi:MAG: T9SS type A sorting domain-containing protein [Flavobacterium sp.]|nr:T9SS type A sorting domain-containing protein [Flavobacterium sp.]
MKKIYFLLTAILMVWQGNAQVLNQNAGWPNAAWTVTGTYNTDPLAFEGNPTTSANFAFDDDDAGQTSLDDIAAESPVIDLTAADAAGETKVRVSAMYTYRILAGYLRLEYWDADAAAWTPWGADIAGNNTTVNNNFCTPAKTMYTSSDLDISAFTATQLSGFRYRIAFDDLNWEWGFCFDSPTIISVPQPCLANATLWPTATVNPGTCDGVTSTQIATNSWAGDYINVNVTTGQTYKFSSSVGTDYFTISTDGNVTAAAAGVTPLTWVSTVTGVIRVNLNTSITCGTQNTNRTTSVICGVPCLNGTGPYPTATYTPTTCDGTTVNVVATDSWAGEYSNIQMFSANSYTISSSIATDYITIANAAGNTALAVGTGSLNFTPTADGVYRLYFHVDSACGSANVDREKRIVCTSTGVAPGCAVNVSPVDGSTTVDPFSPVILTWSAPTTGDPVVSYQVWGGTNPLALNLFGTVSGSTFTYDAGTIGAYDFVGYWQIVAINAAGQSTGCPVWMFTTASQPTDTPDWANLQWPPTITITEGGSDTVYGRVYEPSVTDAAGAGAGILAWVGISDLGDNSDPSGWTNWIPATYNTDSGNNDEYMASIGSTLAPGTYYYATRYTLNGGPYVYGGLNDGFWDAVSHPSGVLTVNPAPAPANDECAGAIALTPGNNFSVNPLTTTNVGATDTTAATPSCQTSNAADVWYSVVVPASGNITIETQANGGMTDSVVAAFSGTCGGTLTQVGCDDDGGPAGPNGLMSILSLTGQTPGSTLYIGVWRYSLGTGVNGSFVISAYDASLATSTFDNASFVAYPNPVKDVLNLSYTQNIDKVQVVNLLGQEMMTKSINAAQSQIDMSNLPIGTYLVRVTANDEVKTIKVIKE